MLRTTKISSPVSIGKCFPPPLNRDLTGSGGSRHSAGGPHHVADLDIRLRGQFNTFPNISCLFLRLKKKVYSQSGWGTMAKYFPWIHHKYFPWIHHCLQGCYINYYQLIDWYTANRGVLCKLYMYFTNNYSDTLHIHTVPRNITD